MWRREANSKLSSFFSKSATVINLSDFACLNFTHDATKISFVSSLNSLTMLISNQWCLQGRKVLGKGLARQTGKAKAKAFCSKAKASDCKDRKPAIFLKRVNIGKSYYGWPIGSRICAFDWCENPRPLMTKAIMHFVSKHMRLSHQTASGVGWGPVWVIPLHCRTPESPLWYKKWHVSPTQAEL